MKAAVIIRLRFFLFMTPNQTSFVRAASQISQPGSAQKIILDGSSVLVRILKDAGGGKYEASVAGNRLVLSSKTPLKSGTVFVGKLSVQDGKITISRNGIQATLTSSDIKTSTFLESGNIFDKILSPELSGLLEALNLPGDNLSFHMLLQHKQLSLKLDASTMKKIRQLSEKTSDPKGTAEKLVSLAQKGFDINSQKINTLLQTLENSYEKDNTDEKQDDFLKLHNSKGFGKKHQNENSWVYIPFEIEKISENEIVGDGIVKLLLSAEERQLLKLNLEINYEKKSYRFLINMDRKKISSVKYSIKNEDGNSSENETITQELKEKLETGEKQIDIEFVPYDALSGTASSLEDFSLAGGFV